jgi:hypothetical protein
MQTDIKDGNVAKWQSRKGAWKFVRVRDDKKSPNADWVALGILKDIFEPVLLKNLLKIADDVQEGWQMKSSGRSKPRSQGQSEHHGQQNHRQSRESQPQSWRLHAKSSSDSSPAPSSAKRYKR